MHRLFKNLHEPQIIHNAKKLEDRDDEQYIPQNIGDGHEQYLRHFPRIIPEGERKYTGNLAQPPAEIRAKGISVSKPLHHNAQCEEQIQIYVIQRRCSNSNIYLVSNTTGSCKQQRFIEVNEQTVWARTSEILP